MKKLIVVFLSLVLVLSFAACTEEEESRTPLSKPPVSRPEESVADVSKVEPSSEPEESKVPEPPEEVLDTGILGPGNTLNRNTAYAVVAENDGHATTYDPTAVRFNQWNGEAELGDTLFLTGEGGTKLVDACTGDYASLEDFAIAVVSYDMATYRYKVTAVSAAGEDKSSLTFPEDGFAIAVSDVLGTENEELRTSDFKRVNASNVANLRSYTVGASVELDGISAKQIHWEFESISKAPVLDGIINIGEYGDAILEFDGTSPEVDYRGFDANDKYATGAFYATYDADNLYLAWEIASEKHECSLAADADAAQMWQYDCVQIVLGAMNPNDSRNLDSALCWSGAPGGANVKAYDWTLEIGIAVNDNGDTLLCKNWFSNNLEFEGKATRNDNTATTIYEVKIPLEAFNAEVPGYETTFEAGTELGVSFSINTSDNGTSRVVRLRDGGGIFGSNDFSKIPTVTLK